MRRARLAAMMLAAVVPMSVATPSSAAGSGVARPYPAAGFQRDLDAIRSAGVPGVLGVVDLNGHRMTGTSGVADLISHAPLRPDGYFRMGSNTKTFVAVVVLQLVREGRLRLDDTVDRWLPGVVSGNGNDGRRITVAELLRHTSGIDNYFDDVVARIGTPDAFREHRFDHATPAQLVSMAMAHAPEFPPGTAWDYSNTNYILLGMIIQRVTGESWAHEVRVRILDPLHLRHTFAPGDVPFLPRPHATGYTQFGPGTELVDTTAFNYTWSDAAGALVTNATDLTRFWQALQRGQLLDPVGMALMHRTVLATTWQAIDPGARYGLGIQWLPLSCGGGYWGHDGDVPGYTTLNAVSADGRRSVVLSLSAELASLDGYQRAEELIDHAMCATG